MRKVWLVPVPGFPLPAMYLGQSFMWWRRYLYRDYDGKCRKIWLPPNERVVERL